MGLERTKRTTMLLPLCFLLASSGGCTDRSKRTDGLDRNPPTLTAAKTPDRTVDDAGISAAIQRKLGRDPALDQAELHVVTTNGIVELTGNAKSLLAKERATLHAEAIKGVRAVSNRVVVQVPDVADDVLERDVKRALRANAVTDAHEVRVVADKGVVKLKGTVQSFPERSIAERMASGTRGVRKVENEIVVEPKKTRSDAEIARDVQGRLRWDALVDAGLVLTDVDQGTVKLTGVVGSAAEKRRASWDAWVAGVKNVDASGIEVVGWARNDDLRKDKYDVKSDRDVEKAIKDAMLYDPRVSSRGVHPSVAGGVATLRGVVERLEAKAVAEQLARHTVGVVSVDNKLEVRPPRVGDLEIERQLKAAFLSNPHTESYEIAVNADQGRVVLTGTVDSLSEKAEAESIAAASRGVRAVDNHLAVRKPSAGPTVDPYVYVPNHAYVTQWHPTRPTKADREIAKEIEDELFWSPFVSAGEVTVVVQDGKATLTGTVGSLREHNAAAENAYEGGAIAVENKLGIRP